VRVNDRREVPALMHAAFRQYMRAIGLLGQREVRKARPILQRIIARSPEGSPERQDAAAALRQSAESQPRR
jgi:hypothetical protein